MSNLTNNRQTTTFGRKIIVVAVISASLATPLPASAGVIHAVKSRVDAIYSQVRSIRNQLSEMIAGMNETKDAFRSGGARQMLTSVTAMLDFVQEGREQYEEFSGTNDCDVGSPCNAYRENLHDLIDDVIALPKELPFVDVDSSRGERLAKVADLIDKVPTPILYASEKVTGNTIEKFLELTGTIRSVAAELPEIPNLGRLRSMSDAAFTTTCKKVYPGNPHILLLNVLLDNTAGTLGDVAGLLPQDKVIGITAVGGVVVNIPHPATATFKQVIMVIKMLKRQLNLRVAMVTSECNLSGFVNDTPDNRK